MNYKMTPREALAIQANQIIWYSRHRADLADAVAALTNVAGIDLDAPMDMVEINRRIPRGGDIEYLCGLGDQS